MNEKNVIHIAHAIFEASPESCKRNNILIQTCSNHIRQTEMLCPNVGFKGYSVCWCVLGKT